MGAPHRVLFVEDYPPFKRSFSRLLTHGYGVEVTVVDSGEEAIRQFGAVNPDLVILDLGLPGVDGTETLQVIRALPGGDVVPVIVLTGSNDPAWVSATAQLGIAGYILKENATREFGDLLLSIFPDLNIPVMIGFEPDGALEIRENDTIFMGRTRRSKRAIRVLLPEAVAEPKSESKRWAHRFVRRARVALPRMFGGVS